MSVEYVDVAEAANALKEEGIEPSVRKVQAKLGIKSHSYIPVFFNLWRGREQQLEDADELPDGFLEDAQLLAQGLWSLAREQSSTREALQLREIERLQREGSEQEATWNEGRAKLEMQARENEAKITALTAEIAELKQQLSQAQ